MDEIDRVIDALNRQKGELLAVQSLLLSVFRGLQLDAQVRAWADFQQEREVARTTLLNTAVPEAILAGYDATIAAIDALRR